MATVLWLSLFALLGVLSHRLYFISGEHHDSSPRIATFYFFAVVASYFFSRSLAKGDESPLVATALRASVYFLGLFSSIVVYRLWFHPIRNFKGPVAARVSKLWHVANCTDAKQYLWLDRLFREYGDFVRTGPNEITIFTPLAVPIIHGPETQCTRSEWYENIKPIDSVIHTRSRALHDARRKIWDQGFSIKALARHEGTVLMEARLLERKIAECEGRGVNVTRWFEYYGYDLMGLVSFSKSFKMLELGKSHWVVDTINGGTATLGPFTGVPWLIHLVHALPFVGRPLERANEWGRRTIRERVANKDQEKSHSDVISWMIEDAQTRNGVEKEMLWMLGDFYVMCVGGTEPVITVLLFMFYRLAQAPQCIEKLREEIRTLTSYSDTIQLQALPYLNALIYETLRLHPSIPSGGLRQTPPQGLDINGTFIPGGVTVLTPQYSIQRREDCFVQANEFIPERWTTRPELIIDRSAFYAWNLGPYSCIGKNLGLMEIRTATVLLLDKFDIRFADGETGERLFKESKDCFSWVPGPLDLVFSKREAEARIDVERERRELGAVVD